MRSVVRDRSRDRRAGGRQEPNPRRSEEDDGGQPDGLTGTAVYHRALHFSAGKRCTSGSAFTSATLRAGRRETASKNRSSAATDVYRRPPSFQVSSLTAGVPRP